MNETDLGFEYSDSNILAFFGKREANASRLQERYPNILFKKLKQVHLDAIVSTSPHSIDFSSEADAHYTHTKNIGLCISTADCTPILIYSPKISQVYAIHAGWRGVAHRIFPKVLAMIQKRGGLDGLQIFIGPHIGHESFEVGSDVKDLLASSLKQSLPSAFSEIEARPGKFLAHLSKIVRCQAQEFSIQDSQIIEIALDTLGDIRFHSYRRDKEASGRQISFIALV